MLDLFRNKERVWKMRNSVNFNLTKENTFFNLSKIRFEKIVCFVFSIESIIYVNILAIAKYCLNIATTKKKTQNRNVYQFFFMIFIISYCVMANESIFTWNWYIWISSNELCGGSFFLFVLLLLLLLPQQF